MTAFWNVEIIVPWAAADAFEAAMGDEALAVSRFEVEEHVNWRIEALYNGAPDDAGVAARLAALAAAMQIDMPATSIAALEDRDWLAHVYAGFRPLRAGRFFVHGSHHQERPPAGTVAICVDAATAFGSGEHETTRSCLKAIDRLARHMRPRMVLDMGCGTGILGFAALKAMRMARARPLVLVDIDAEAVRVTDVNARINRLHPRCRTAAGPGYDTPLVAKARPAGGYDLILANILARPLVHLAPDLARNLAPGGYAVLAGLLTRQEKMVLHAHRQQGLVLTDAIHDNGWSILTLRKGRQRR